MNGARVLIVDDEVSMREFLEILLVKAGYDVTTAAGGYEAIARLSGGNQFDLVLTDLKMPRGDGLEVLEFVKRNAADTQVIVMTAFSTAETAIQAMRLGAYDYISKPFKVDEISVVIEKCLEKQRLQVENRRLLGALRDRYSFSNIVGKSRAIREVFEIIERVAQTRTNILVYGETGTGKELVAKAIHYNSPRRQGPFLVINCGAIPDNLMESELFGHMKGSFTGAVSNKKGLFEESHGGTLFLDEIGELSLQLQVKLLRVLQERRVKPIGGAHERAVDVRIVAATNRDLEVEVAEDRFRQDLYYRLNVIQLEIPPLRSRREDIPLLVNHFLDRFSKEMAKPLRGIAPDALDRLMSYPFVGNVRELENIIERAATFEISDVITRSSLPPHVLKDRERQAVENFADVHIPTDGMDLEGLLHDVERRYLIEALRRTHGNRTEAAKLLGMSFRSIRYKLSKLDVPVDK